MENSRQSNNYFFLHTKKFKFLVNSNEAIGKLSNPGPGKQQEQNLDKSSDYCVYFRLVESGGVQIIGKED